MKIAVTVMALVLLVMAMAWGAAACGSDETAACQVTSHPAPTVMGIHAGPDWSHVPEGGPVPVTTEVTWSHQLLEK